MTVVIITLNINLHIRVLLFFIYKAFESEFTDNPSLLSFLSQSHDSPPAA